eukprot:m.67210 g.67210  ORF g.67210 m.67210 type:complete len:381 (+) comp11870_c0_seq1:232-1374(+)
MGSGSSVQTGSQSDTPRTIMVLHAMDTAVLAEKLTEYLAFTHMIHTEHKGENPDASTKRLEAISESRIVLILCSPALLASPACREEVDCAFYTSKPVCILPGEVRSAVRWLPKAMCSTVMQFQDLNNDATFSSAANELANIIKEIGQNVTEDGVSVVSEMSVEDAQEELLSIDEIVEVLEMAASGNRKHNPAVFTRALQDLYALCLNENDSQELVAKNVVQLTIQLGLKVKASNVVSICTAFHHMICSTPKLRPQLVQDGTIETIEKMLVKHTKVAVVQAQGFLTILHLGCDNHALVVDSGFVTLIHKAINTHPRDAHVHLHAIRLLSALASSRQQEVCAGNREKVIKSQKSMKACKAVLAVHDTASMCHTEAQQCLQKL